MAALLAAAGCAKPDARAGDETHFLACHVDDDCNRAGASYRCEEGFCRIPTDSAATPPPTGAPLSTDAGRGAPPAATNGAAPPAASGAPRDGGRELPVDEAVLHRQDAGAASSHADAEAPPGDGDASAPPTVLATVAGQITAQAMDADALYFVTSSVGTANGSIWSVPKDGHTPPKPLATAPVYVEGLAVDDRYAYFTDLVAGTVNRLVKSAGQPEVIATGQTRPWGIAVDGVAVYWANQGTNQAGVPGNAGASIMSLSKAGRRSRRDSTERADVRRDRPRRLGRHRLAERPERRR